MRGGSYTNPTGGLASMIPRATRWDLTLARRTGVVWALLGVLALTVAIATDEADATAATRLARWLSLCPALAAIAVALVARRLEAEGDVRALAAVGIGRGRALAGAIGCGALVGLLAASALAAGFGSLDGLFPRLSGDPWRHEAGVFHGPGVSFVGWGGAATFGARGSTLSPPTHARFAVGAALALFALGLPTWLAIPQRPWVRASVATLLVVAAILAFHLVAAGREPAALLAPPAGLLAYLAALGLRSRFYGLPAHR